MGEHRLGRRDQVRAQGGVGQIGARLGEIAQPVFDGPRRAAERGELWEDPPDPVRELPPRAEFAQGEGEVTGLRGVEAVSHGGGWISGHDFNNKSRSHVYSSVIIDNCRIERDYMADISFPQIPASVWWGVRQVLQKTPRGKFDENTVAAVLGVQPVAARQYLKEFQKVGILDDELRGTELAGKWRMDESYAEAITEIANSVYPEALVSMAPPGEVDRQRVTTWFMHQGLGEGAARNKAAFYVLLTSPEPNSVPMSGSKSKAIARQPTRKADAITEPAATTPPAEFKAHGRVTAPTAIESLPLNVNLQIHISADASTEQIEAIFSAMRKYLRDA
ncbi:hypothetical protein SDC9_28815 [bioreactor metagenome]|uniref:DUF5343 domain-containing protein n=1 Tax=bioreactor metagenome TaxID=1076179 RepID=A0A644UUX2_9ZZZZ